MSRPLRVLLVEDSERDAALLLLYLRRSTYQPVIERVETAAEMEARLQSGPFDVVISDMNLPRFNAASALKLLRDSGSTIPFLVLSGDIDEQVAKELFSAGATRYLLKDRMADVVAAIDQALKPDA
jgi:CheY-like chemotaxis protein